MIERFRQWMSATWKPTSEEDFMCLHEAGHAVVARSAGCAVNQVMAKELGEDARIGFTDYAPPGHLSFFDQRWTDIGVLYGGKAAESLIGDRESSKGIAKDEEDVRKILAQLHAISQFDEKKETARCEKRAREIISANKGALCRLAKELKKEGSIEGKPLHKILQTARDPQ